jgi:4-amino-4-deoxy-L-arabinose transferase-like glycosyltransferase
MAIAALAAWLVGPSLFTRGMFVDGVVYATISRNLAAGIGDLWNPIYTERAPRVFHDHPPLGFALQSLAFRLFGDHFWVERLYSVAWAPLLMLAISLLWRLPIGRRGKPPIGGWFPVLLWMTIPTWGWLYKNNILENALTPFTVLSIYCSLRLHGGCRPMLWSGLAAASMLAAALIKGPVGLFPAVAPLVAGLALADRRWAAIARNQAAILIWFALLVTAVFAYSPARHAVSEYFQQQIASSLSGERGALHGRFYLVAKTATALALPAAIAILIHFASRRRFAAAEAESPVDYRAAAFFGLTALSASLPLLASPRQSAMYAAPSYPFFILAIARLAAPAVERLLLAEREWIAARYRYGALKFALGGLIAAACLVSVARYGRIERDIELLHDVARIEQYVPASATVAVPAALQNDFQLRAYLYRRHYVSVCRPEETAPYFVASSQHGFVASAGLVAAESENHRYHLFVKAPTTAQRR